MNLQPGKDPIAVERHYGVRRRFTTSHCQKNGRKASGRDMMHERGRERIQEMNVVDRQDNGSSVCPANDMTSDHSK